MITKNREIQIPSIRNSLREQPDTTLKSNTTRASVVAASILLGVAITPAIGIPVSVPLFQTLNVTAQTDPSAKRKRRQRPTTPEYLAAVAAEPINYCDVVDASETAIWDVTASDGLI